MARDVCSAYFDTSLCEFLSPSRVKGDAPVRSSNIRIPRLHQSTDWRGSQVKNITLHGGKRKYSEQISLPLCGSSGDACYRPQYYTSDPSVVFSNIMHLSHLCSGQTLSYKFLVWLHSSLILLPKFVTPRAHWRHLQFKYPRLHSEYGFIYFKNK